MKHIDWRDYEAPKIERDFDCVPYKGAAPSTFSNLKIGEAEDLLDQASKLIHKYANLMGFGDNYELCSDFLQKFQSYSDEQKACAMTGKDWRQPTKEEREAKMTPYDLGYSHARGEDDPHDKCYQNPFPEGSSEHDLYDDGYWQSDSEQLI